MEGLEHTIVDCWKWLKYATFSRWNCSTDKRKNQAVSHNLPTMRMKALESGECFHLFCLALARRLLCAMRSLQVSEAGDIEQDASIIILLWNLDNEDKTRKGLKVDKNRQGELGKIVYRFDGNEMRFQETEEELKSKDGFKTVRTPTPFD